MKPGDRELDGYALPLAIAAAFGTYAVAQFLLFPLAGGGELEAFADGVFLLVPLGGLAVLARSRLVAHVRRPLLGAMFCIGIYGLTDATASLVVHPGWYLLVFELGFQLTGIGLILVGIRRWGRERDRRERMLRERTADLERQTERLQNFASVVTHDLRNPLQVAMTNLDIARNEHDTERLVKIEDALDRMDHIIENVLELSRLGEDAIDESVVDLETIARDAWETVESTDARLVIEADARVRADADHLQQAFENLFRNALEHGGPGVTVTVGTLPDGFSVTDDGPGIPPANREHVFESGFSTDTQGTGFGLSIVERIVEAHGWAISIAEGDDGGARFEITGVEATGESDAATARR